MDYTVISISDEDLLASMTYLLFDREVQNAFHNDINSHIFLKKLGQILNWHSFINLNPLHFYYFLYSIYLLMCRIWEWSSLTFPSPLPFLLQALQKKLLNHLLINITSMALSMSYFSAANSYFLHILLQFQVKLKDLAFCQRKEFFNDNLISEQVRWRLLQVYHCLNGETNSNTQQKMRGSFYEPKSPGRASAVQFSTK